MKRHDRDDDWALLVDSVDATVAVPLKDPHAFLKSLRPFSTLDSDVLKLLRSRMTEQRVEPGGLLIQQGDPGTSLAVIAEGEVDVFVEEDGNRHLLKRAGPGEVLGEMALLTGEPRSASVVAVTPLTAWVLPADEFHDLATHHPKISVVLTRLLSSRLGTAEHDALSGKTFYDYRIARRLGFGGMSVVYEAVEASSGRRVALKMMSHRLLYDPVGLARFKREAEIIESFDHPNIARMYGRFEAFRTAFIVMEFCEGVAIDVTLDSRGSLPEPVVRRILGQVAEALAYAHGARVIHRDVKPSNVIITRAGVAKLMDFGLARRVDEAPGRKALVGTPRYMAPEQMMGKRATTETDLFALGHLAFEMLCGRTLFEGRSFRRLRKAVIACRIPDLAASCPGASAEMLGVLSGLLVREPERRAVDFDLLRSWAGPVDFETVAKRGE